MVTAVDRGRWTCAPDGDAARRPSPRCGPASWAAPRRRRRPGGAGRRPVRRARHPRPHRPGRGADDGPAPHRRRHRPRRTPRGGERRTARDRHRRRRPDAAHRVRRPLPGRRLRGRAVARALPDQGRPRRPRAVRRAVRRAGAAGDRHPARRPDGRARDALAGRVSALVGHSGVGKSTLVNTLVPDAAWRSAWSAVGKGRHTTVAALALPLPEDAPAAGSSTPPGSGRSGSRTSPRTTCSRRSTTSRRRSRTARAAAGTSGRPPTRNARSTRWSPRATARRPGSPALRRVLVALRPVSETSRDRILAGTPTRTG